MNILKNLFSRKDYFRESKQVIEYAFTSGGVDYFQHTDEMNLPYKRALKALTIYKELEMKCDRYYLDQHLAAMDAILEGRKFNIDSMVKLKILQAQLKERVQWIIVPDHVYKLASVRFFDANENPNDYDWKYAAKKIEHWKKHENVKDFFLREPIVRLIPFLKDAPVDFQTFSEAIEEMERVTLASIYPMLPQPEKFNLLSSTDRLFWEETRTGK